MSREQEPPVVLNSCMNVTGVVGDMASSREAFKQRIVISLSFLSCPSDSQTHSICTVRFLVKYHSDRRAEQQWGSRGPSWVPALRVWCPGCVLCLIHVVGISPVVVPLWVLGCCVLLPICCSDVRLVFRDVAAGSGPR